MHVVEKFYAYVKHSVAKKRKRSEKNSKLEGNKNTENPHWQQEAFGKVRNFFSSKCYEKKKKFLAIRF